MTEFEYKTISIDSKETEHSSEQEKGKEKKATALWIVIGVGMLLIVNHGIQLLF